MKIIEIHVRIIKNMKKMKFQKRIMKNNKNHIIPLENNENLETKSMILCENQENH